MSDSASKVMAKINKMIDSEYDQEIDKIYVDIFEKNSKNEQLPETVFIDSFLPFFAGKIQDNRDLKITTNWIAIAGSPMNEVDVVDNAGKVLFTVPPLMSTDFLKTDDNIRGRTFTEIFNHARLQSNRIPTLGDKVIGTEGVERVAQMKAIPEPSEISSWNKIFDRYNVPVVVKNDLSTQETSVSGSADDLEYD